MKFKNIVIDGDDVNFDIEVSEQETNALVQYAITSMLQEEIIVLDLDGATEQEINIGTTLQ